VGGAREGANMSVTLRKGQRLRPRHPALAEREWGVEGDAVGTVLCSYHVQSDPCGAADRVDIKFAAGRVIWGAPATEFAIVAESQPDLR
jgi:hypothetical protein